MTELEPDDHPGARYALGPWGKSADPFDIVINLSDAGIANDVNVGHEFGGKGDGVDRAPAGVVRGARKVCDASSRVGLTPSTTPINKRKAVGVNENTCASQTPLKP